MRNWSIKEKGKETKLVSFLMTVFFIFLADAILSDWVPGFVQGIVKKPMLMGIVVSFSSVVGVVMDFVFSEILEGSRVKKLIWWSFLGCLSFVGLLGVTIFKPWWWILLLAMASWGFYYDLFNFFSQQFVAENAKRELRASWWGVVGFVRNLAYFVGPIIGTNLISRGNLSVVMGASGSLIVAGLLLSGFKEKKVRREFSHRKVGLKQEMKHWQVLFGRVWPLLAMSLLLNFIDATYWTTGTIVSDLLARESWWGGMFLPFYVLPSLFVGGVMTRLRIERGKKKMALAFLIGAGWLLMLLDLGKTIWWKLGIVLVSSVFLAVSWPLVNAVYSDLVERMGRQRETLLGLADSMMNIAYIFGPIVAGLIAGVVGEEKTFVVVGWITLGASLILWLVMPKKLKLPQKEMKKWEEMTNS